MAHFSQTHTDIVAPTEASAGDATDRDWPQGPEIVEAERSRVSVWATFGLMIGLLGIGLTLTGLLAPPGAAVGGLGLLTSVVGLFIAGRPGVAGRGLAVLGVLLGLAAVVLGGLAMTHDYSWPNSQTDEVSRLHDWLVDRWAWLGRW